MTNDLTFTGNIPVTINFNGSADDVYAPIRSSSCDIKIVSKDLLTDLYTAVKDEIEVEVKKDNNIIWQGYMTPNVYSQKVSQHLDQIAMTAIDPVALMKYVKISKIITRPNVLTYGDLIGKSLAYVKFSGAKLYMDRSVTYGTGTYEGDNGLLDLSIQVSNFWDEAGEPSSIYDMIGEMLRPFCSTLVFDGKNFYIYNINEISPSAKNLFEYNISESGVLTATGNQKIWISDFMNWGKTDWISNNVKNTSIEINPSYDKVTGVASTSVPTYNSMVTDKVDYSEVDKYDTFAANVQRNPVKGHTKKDGKYVFDDNDYWLYLWSGVYCDDDYNLNSLYGHVDGYNPCNKLYEYVNGADTGHDPSDWGSCLHFAGGANNPNGTGKTPTAERPVDVNERITVYAEDNGTPLEFLDRSDLKWSYNGHIQDDETGYVMDPWLVKSYYISSKFGESKNMTTSNRKVYHQEYINMTLIQSNEQTIDFDLTHSFSRTGIESLVDTMASSMCEKTSNGKKFFVWDYVSEDKKYGQWMFASDTYVYHYPARWKAENVVVDYLYFNKYNKGNGKINDVWDKRRIDIYVQLNDGTIYQFNGKEWVKGTKVSASNSFYLSKKMNGERLYHSDFKYDKIYIRDDCWSLDKDNTTGTKGYYSAPENEWVKIVKDSSAGHLSICLPDINAVNVTVYVDVYNSTMLGMTGGNALHYTYNPYAVIGNRTLPDTLIYTVDGRGYSLDGTEWTLQSSDFYDGVYGSINTLTMETDFLPANVSYVKAEHLDLSITISTQESNLGKMFKESDIKYVMNKNNNYLEQFEGPTFRINTYHPLVASSFSYLISNNEIADARSFYFYSNIVSRPESFVVQAYINWLYKIRKVYKKTLIPETRQYKDFNNICTYIKSPETGDNRLMVVSDSWDVKTNRHTIEAIECDKMKVETVETFQTIEIPRTARNGLYNLPTAKK